MGRKWLKYGGLAALGLAALLGVFFLGRAVVREYRYLFHAGGQSVFDFLYASVHAWFHRQPGPSLLGTN